MKVNNKPTQPFIQNKNLDNAANSKLDKQAKSKQAANLFDATKVDLSPRAKDINKAMQIAQDTKTDSAKLDRLQKMIDKGEYKVDAEGVADKLVNEHLIFRS